VKERAQNTQMDFWISKKKGRKAERKKERKKERINE
jgi:hypothetical protein